MIVMSTIGMTTRPMSGPGSRTNNVAFKRASASARSPNMVATGAAVIRAICGDADELAASGDAPIEIVEVRLVEVDAGGYGAVEQNVDERLDRVRSRHRRARAVPIGDRRVTCQAAQQVGALATG